MLKIIVTLLFSSLYFKVFDVYCQDLQNGTFTIVAPWNKYFKASVTYKNGIPDGTWTIDRQGMVSLDTFQCTYVNGKLNGFAYVKNTEGTIIERTDYQNNEINGKREAFNYKNELISFYTYQNGMKQGKFKTLNGSGYFDSGYLNGIYIGKNNYSKVEIRGNYLKSQRVGCWEIERGKYKYEVNFKENNLNGPYKIYQYLQDNSLQLIESGVMFDGELHGKRVRYSKGTYVFSASFYNQGIIYSSEKYFFGDSSLKEIWTWDTINNKFLRKTWFKNGDLKSKAITINGKTKHFEYYKNERLKEEWVYGESISPQYYRHYDTIGQLRSRDTFYMLNGNRHFDSYSYRNDSLIGEKHVLEMKRVGRWYSENRWDGKYVNGSFVGNCSQKWELENAPQGEFYFKPHWDSDGGYLNPLSLLDREYPSSANIWLKVDTSEHRFNGLTSLKARNAVVKYIKKYDTLNLKGEVIFKCYVNSNGQVCSPQLIKGLHPFYNRVILYHLLWKTVPAVNGIKPSWVELKYEF